jgi:hypothetical protein
MTVVINGTTGITVAANAAPAFSAYPSSSQSITSNTATKILFQTTEFDTTGGMYSSSRFTPTIAGYYQTQVSIYPSTATTSTQAAIYKNGALYKRNFINAADAVCAVSALVYLNGTTDYIEGYGTLVGTSPSVFNSSPLVYFQASMARSA